ncbi:hypothetical protein G6F70_005068 [Rhizopus microsporus]|uniref:RhoGAP-domain-containing protein n=1 Tax=Rhizopus azygosporus TaxID=86630 RepID=A0A367K0X0_RHIAZ|nr:hypothetical protein G6F71_003362 [Rhizopus microsporus]RCH95853.1 hypothetical protein CU097_013696 [Rhizopus azygosporus]KAG1199275.1 hypothetical protein G6F70_005068 [Rhizopus microsporus]KAG1213028.1 hypothetical protein G6F69_003175 [Rhizopus microsporus]KAG1235023.1 hypothetical protein G6F67_003084 [Rhizopus microsporus]
MLAANGSQERILDNNKDGQTVISTLTNLEGGFQCLLDKVKSDTQVAKDVTLFLKKRAAIEEEYGKQMIKLAQSMSESFDKGHLNLRSFGTSWLSFLKVHEKIGEQRMKFASDIIEVADDVQIMCKDTEKGRKQIKELGLRHEKNRIDAEITLEKSKQKYEQLSEDWEKAILNRNQNETDHNPKKTGLFKNNKTPAQLKKQEDESCAKANQAYTAYKNQLQSTNATRQEFFRSQLPSNILALKGLDDECCTAIRYQLARYAYIYEEALVLDGLALDNDEGNGLRSLTEKIDHGVDTEELVKEFSRKAQPLNKEDIQYKEYVMSPLAMNILKPNPVFGVSLIKLMERDKREIPLIVTKCVEAIEEYGLKSVGLYRLSGTNTHIQRLKNEFDFNCEEVDLSSEENRNDINNITSLLKLWFRELPDPVFPRSSYQHFMNAAKIENERMRVLGLHTIINDLPDAHYATLKYIMRHLDKVQQYQEYNKMTTSNIATILGMSLMGGDENHIVIVQTVLENYRLIFEPDEEQ